MSPSAEFCMCVSRRLPLEVSHECECAIECMHTCDYESAGDGTGEHFISQLMPCLTSIRARISFAGVPYLQFTRTQNHISIKA